MTDLPDLTDIDTTTHVHACGCAVCGSDAQRPQPVEFSDGNELGDPEAPLNTPDVFSLEQVIAQLARSDTFWDKGALTVGFMGLSGPGAFYGDGEGDGFSVFQLEQREATELAVQMWEDVIDVNLSVTQSFTSDIRLGNTITGPGHAWAYFPDDSAEGGDIWINPDSPSNFELDIGGYGLTTLLHEIGHSLGIDHPSDYEFGASDWARDADYYQDSRQFTVMSYFDAEESDTGADHYDPAINDRQYGSTPLLHDIAVAQSIYGARMETRDEDTVYGFNSTANRDVFDWRDNPNPVVAIWDGGGVDTVDLSGYDSSVVFDLTEGAFSSIGDLTYNVSIAYGAVIENLIGGSSFDDLYGNAADNTIDGGDGDDYLFGGAGDDALWGRVGVDELFGEDGNDKLRGNGGGDRLKGNAGKDNLIGDKGDDTLIGDKGKDKLKGGTGDDMLRGSKGRDRYIVGEEEGKDVIDEQGDTDTTKIDRLILKDWTALPDAEFEQDGNDLRILMGDGNRITVLGQFGDDAAQQIEEVQLGTSSESRYALGQTGGEGMDLLVSSPDGGTLNAGAGDDILFSGEGDDILTGGTGNDSYVFKSGDGDDQIIEAGSSDDVDVIVLANQSSRNAFTLTQSGDDLELAFGSGGSITVTGQFADATSAIETLRLSDGTEIDLTQPADDWLG
ncbi:MAG: hypothetical protein Alpg2KO_08190 [Alphaproteobacteria bacterium]